MSMTMPIPRAMRDRMNADPFYKKCCVTGIEASPWVRIERHHAFTWAGKRVNEYWCIVPLEKEIHRRVHEKWIAEVVEWVILNRAGDDTLRKYSKARDLIKRRDQLNAQYLDYENQENKSLLHNLGF